MDSDRFFRFLLAWLRPLQSAGVTNLFLVNLGNDSIAVNIIKPFKKSLLIRHPASDESLPLALIYVCNFLLEFSRVLSFSTIFTLVDTKATRNK